MKLEKIAKNICLNSKFTFLKFQGQGEYKEVYKIQCNGIYYALKIFNQNLHLERQKREIDAILKCCHQNIAKIEISDTITFKNIDYLYCIEEFLDKGTLAEKMKEGFLCNTSLVKFAYSLTSALAHLNSLQLVHRDLKPENIMFRDNSMPVITDFGLVRDLTKTGLTMSYMPYGPGTPYYSSPEQLNNDKDYIDWRSDQFSLGVILSLIAFDVHPYGCDAVPTNRTVINVESKSKLSPEFYQNKGHQLFPIIHKMVEPFPYERFRKPRLIIEELDSIYNK